MKSTVKILANSLGYDVKKRRNFASNSIAFLHIGKTAGTQIKTLMTQINALQTKTRLVGLDHFVRLEDLPPDEPYFFSIRNPAARFKSGFYSRKRKGQPRLYNEWKKQEERSFQTFSHANDLAEALSAEGEMREQAFWAMNSIGHVRRLQMDWFDRAGFVLVDRPPVHIVRQEHFTEDFAAFLEKLDLGIGLDQLALAESSRESHSFDYEDVPALSDLALENLATWYRRDFEFYRSCSAWIAG